ncbi:MAG TPA: histidinol-phosphate transaminase [Aliidongia sp.]|nr:histidinol-phosphate transaminase [Aliidongia sp.]
MSASRSEPSDQAPTGPVVRPGVLDLAPYVGGESKAPGVNRIIKLSSNEGALGPSPQALAAAGAGLAAMHRYPDGGAEALRAALAAEFGLDAARIVCGSGSDDLILQTVRAYAGPGDEVLYSEHGFLIYAISALSVGATPVSAPETGYTASVDALLAKVTERTRIVFLANPNNPTGTYLAASEVRRLHAGLPPHVVLAIDSAYAEFVETEDYEPGIELVQSAENVVMLRTFSKIYALGGMRVGWAYGSAGIIDVLNRLRMPFNVSGVGQAAAIAALADHEHTERSRRHNATWRDWTADALRGLGLDVTPSVCNFLLVHFRDEQEADGAFEYLKQRGILARKVGAYRLPQCLRISIGLEDEMRLAIAALAKFLGTR